MKITLFTDGSSRGNPGPGGYGIVLQSSEGHFKEYAEGFRKTTNNRMELMAVIVGLEKIRFAPATVDVYSDSKYVVDAVNKGWVFGWEKKGFAGKANPDLWMRFLKIYRKHQVKFYWIKGHNNQPQNERCDRLAVEASKKPNLKTDAGFKENEGGMF